MNQSVGNFVHDLVEMAKAFDELPGTKAELEAAKRTIDSQQSTIQRLELKLMDRAGEINELRSEVRKAEVARDDAELRFLELDEKSAKVVRFLAQIQGMAVQAEVELVPPKPEPVKEPESMSSPDPYNNPADRHDMFPEQGYYAPLPEGSESSTSQGSVGGESVADPTSAPTPISEQTPIQEVGSVTSAGNQSTEVKPSEVYKEHTLEDPLVDPGPAGWPPTQEHPAQTDDPHLPVGPYSGKLYINYPDFISRAEWLAGGGTEESYNFRHDKQA